LFLCLSVTDFSVGKHSNQGKKLLLFSLLLLVDMQSVYIFIKTIVSFGDTFPVQEMSRLIICCSIICFNLFPFIILLLVSVFLLYSLVFILVLDCHGHFIVRKPSNKGSEMN
jgi:hypothetical protein